MNSLASLVLQVNATSVTAATTSLNQLATAGANAQTATGNLTRATQQANSSILANQQAWFSNTAAINSSTNALSHLANGFKSAFFGASIAVGLIELKNNLINLTDTLIRTQVQVDKLRNSLNFAVGRGAAAGDLAFIKQSAQDMGLSFVTVTEQYVQLAAASRQTSLEGQKTKDIFTAVSQASTVLGLSADETTGALRAITQMISKNTVMSEELKGQLGERLPGAFQIAARAMGVTTQELNKMLETGKVLAEDFLPKFAAQLMRETAPDIEAASQSMQASLNRLETAWTLFKQAVVKSGVGQSMSEETSGLANYFTVLSESMDRSRESGAGLSSQLMTGLGTALARMPFDVVNSSANLLNGTINLLSGGFIHLSTNVNVLPQMFETSAYASKMLGERLKSAEQDLASLQAKLAMVPDNIYLKDSTYQAYLLVQQLKAAKQAQDSLSGNAGRGSINPETVAQLEASAERRQQKINDLMLKSSGISDAYVKRAKEIQEANAGGALSADQLSTALDGLYKLLPKVTSAKVKLSDAQKSVNAGDKAYGDIMAIETGFAANFTETVLSLVAARDKNNWSSDKYNEVIAKYVSLQPGFKAMAAEEKKEAEAAAKRWGEGYVRQVEAEEKAYRKLADAIDEIDKSINDLLRENDALQASNELGLNLMGQTALVREYAIEQQKVLNKYIKEENELRLKELDPVVLASKLELIAVQKARALELSAQSKSIAEWNKTFDTIESGLISALMNSGEDGGKAARDAVAKIFILDPIEIVVKAYLQPVTTALTNLAIDATGLASTSSASSTSSGIMSMANTASTLFGATSTFGLGMQGTIATIAEQGFIGGFANAMTSTASLASAGSWLGAAGAAIPYVGAALAIIALLSSAGNDRLPSQGTGEGQISFDATGAVTDSYSRFGEGDSNLGLTEAVTDTITALYTNYANTAAALGIKMVDTEFSFGANTGLEGKDPQFAIGSNAGGVGYSSGEIQQTDEAIQLAASRAVFNALQQSELPKYLAGAFDGIDASTATQEQITAALDGASALQSFHDQLQLLPWDSLKDMTYATTQALVDMSGGLDALQSSLGTYYENFYTESEKTSDLTTATVNAFADLGITMPTATEGLRDWYRGLVDSVLALDQSDAANAGATIAVLALQGAVDELAPAFEDATKAIEEYQKWQDKLDVLNGVTTEREIQLRDDLAAAADDATRSLIEQVYAIEDLSAAQQVAMDAVTSSVQTAKDAAQAAYDVQVAGIQSTLDTWVSSVSKLQSLSDTLKSTLDSMSISGSDGLSRRVAQAQISAALATARTSGTLPLDGQLDSALQTVAQPSEKLFATFTDYARDFYKTANDISSLSELAGAQLTADQVTQDLLTQQLTEAKAEFDEQIKYLDAQAASAQALIDSVSGTTTATLSVVDAVAAVQAAVTALQEALKPGSTGTKNTANGGSEGIMGSAGDVWGTGYINDNKKPENFNTLYGGFFDPYLDNVDAAKSVIQGLDWSDPSAAINQLWQAQQDGGGEYGNLTNNILSAASGFTPEEIQAMFASQGLQSFGAGTNFVPEDMIAQIHKGEEIVPAPWNPVNSSRGPNNDEMLAKFDVMISRLERIEASNNDISSYTKRTDNTLVRVTRGGEQMQVGSDTAIGSVLAL